MRNVTKLEFCFSNINDQRKIKKVAYYGITNAIKQQDFDRYEPQWDQFAKSWPNV